MWGWLLLGGALGAGAAVLGAYVGFKFGRVAERFPQLINLDDLHDVPMGLPDDEETR